MSIVLCAILLPVFFTQSCISLPLDEFYPYERNLVTSLPRSDDGHSAEINIIITFPFFNKQFNSLYVNTNGMISFEAPVTQFTMDPFPLGDGRVIIAPFWSDVDIRKQGEVLYNTMTLPEILEQATQDVRNSFPQFKQFIATWTFAATWYKVPFYGSQLGNASVNTFQTVLITNGRYSFVRINYHEITWTSGTASGGNSLGLGGVDPECGFNAGDGLNSYSITKAGNLSVFDLPRRTNVPNAKPGMWMFRIDNVEIQGAGCSNTDTFYLKETNKGVIEGDDLYVTILRNPNGTINRQVTLSLQIDFTDERGYAKVEDFSALIEIQNVTFEPNVTSKTVFVGTSKDNKTPEVNRRFSVKLASRNAFVNVTTPIEEYRIDDNDVFFNCYPTPEAKKSHSQAVFAVVRQRVGSTLDDEIWCYPYDGTANAANDYVPELQKIFFEGSSASPSMQTIRLRKDDFPVQPKYFYVKCFIKKDFHRNIVQDACKQMNFTIIDDQNFLFYCPGMNMAPTEDMKIYQIEVCRSGPTELTQRFRLCHSHDTNSNPSFQHRCIDDNFLAGETRKVINITITDDNVVEPRLTRMTIGLQSRTATLKRSGEIYVNVDLIDDDVKFSFANDTPITAIEGTGLVKATIERTGSMLPFNISLELDFTAGAATNADCIGQLKQQLSFKENELSKTVRFCDVVFDNLAEHRETFLLNLTADDPKIQFEKRTREVIIISLESNVNCSTTSNVTENQGNTQITLERVGTERPTEIWCNATDGTAVFPIDYTSRSSLIKFDARADAQRWTIPILADTTPEADETFYVSCNTTDPRVKLLPSCTNMQITIINDDAYIFFCPGYATTISEGDGPYTVQLCRVGSLKDTLTVRLCWTSDANGEPYDFPSVNQGCENIVFAVGDAKKSHGINITDDKWGEQEFKNIQISATGNDKVIFNGSSSYNLSIHDNDNSFCIAKQMMISNEENRRYVNVTVKRWGAITTSGASVTPKHLNGSALQGRDYNYQIANRLNFAQNEKEKTKSIEIIDDKEVEEDEEFYLALTGESGSSIFSECENKSIVTISSNDVNVFCGIYSYNASEDNKPLTLNFNRTGAIQYNHTIRIQTVDGTAKSSEDFVPVDTVLTFSPNQTHLNYDVMFVNDAIMEPDEVFHIDVTTSDRRVNIKCPRIDFNIINDDARIVCLNSTITLSEGNQTVNFTVKKDGIFKNDTQIWFSTIDGTAYDDADYQPVIKQNITFEPGQEYSTQSVDIFLDNFYEATEYFSVIIGTNDPNVFVPKNCTRIYLVDTKQQSGITQKQEQEIAEKQQSIETLLIAGIILVSIAMIAVVAILVCIVKKGAT